MIILYESNSTEEDLKTQGLGGLPDAINPAVTEERNGPYTFEMQYPVNGLHFSEIKHQRIIKAKPNLYDDAQPFRIYKITRPVNGVVTIYAQHISYDLSGIPVAPFSAGSCAEALLRLKGNAMAECPFTFWTDKETAANMRTVIPTSLRSLLGGIEGSILDTYGGGEYQFDNYAVKLYQTRGQNRGVVLRYGKNITDITQDEECSNMATGVCGFWYKEDAGIVQQTVKIDGTFPYENILTVDFSGEWEGTPTADQLQKRIQRYISENELERPKVSITVSFIDTPPSPDLKALSTVRLCDTITVKFEKLGIDAKAKIVKTVYDVLNDRYSSIEIGDAKTNLVNTIADTQKKASTAVQGSVLENAMAHAAKLINGVLGGHVLIWNNQTKLPNNPNEILIMDTDDIKTAQQVWRFNLGGWAHSSTGYTGKFDVAATQKGALNADMITTGILHAVQIMMGEKTVDFPNDTEKHYPVEMYPDGRAYFSGAIHIGKIDETTKVNVANISEDGAATFSNLTVATGKIIGSEYESMKDEADKSKSTRMKLDSGSLEFYRGDYQQDSQGNYGNDEKQVELDTYWTSSEDHGARLNAVNGNTAALASEGTNVFYTENGEGYFGAAIHGNNKDMDGLGKVTAKTFDGNLVWDDVTNKPDDYPGGCTGKAGSVDWSNVQNPPSSYAPSAHSHASLVSNRHTYTLVPIYAVLEYSTKARLYMTQEAKDDLVDNQNYYDSGFSGFYALKRN